MRKKNRIGLLVLLTTCLNLTKITKFQDHRKETRLIMPKKIVIWKDKETKLSHEINTTTCNAKTCLYSLFLQYIKTCFIMPKILFIWKERETKLCSQMITTNWNAKTCLYQSNKLFFFSTRKDMFDTAKNILHMQRKKNCALK